ncbi:MAG TPA: hypothetical protein VIH59_29430 [Candidatus Tectomicrobia bacterium]
MCEEVLATIFQDGSDNVLEVAIIHDGATDPTVELRYLSWGTGLGWYRQHTLKLDRTAAWALLRTFGPLRRRLAKGTSSASGQQVIPLARARHTPGTLHRNAV